MRPRVRPRLVSYAGVRRVLHGAGRRCSPAYLDALNRAALTLVLQHVAVTPYKTLDAGVVAAPPLIGLTIDADGTK